MRQLSSNILFQNMKNKKFTDNTPSDNDCHSDGFIVNNKQFRDNLRKTIEKINFQRSSVKRKTDSPKKTVLLRKSSKKVIGRELRIIICDDDHGNFTPVAK